MTTFDLADAVLPVRPAVRAELEREWTRLAQPGAWFTGAERVAMAAEARAALTMTEAGSGLPDVVVEVAQAVATDAMHIRRDWVEDVVGRGVRVEAYTEVVGVVSRLCAVDTYVKGVGATEVTLPEEPANGKPSHETNPEVTQREAFVPTAVSDNAPYALSAAIGEAEAMLSLHGPIYLTLEQMGDLHHQSELSRVQIEFVAAHTSWLNDCFY
ncbi:MAG: hypothetical protein ACR2H3_13340 [Acidimicrobiales bacterium]